MESEGPLPLAVLLRRESGEIFFPPVSSSCLSHLFREQKGTTSAPAIPRQVCV